MDKKATTKKKVILTLCKVFPVTHSRSQEPTGFEGKLKDGSKIHTIRFNGKNVWQKRYQDISQGRKYLSVREWTGRPYNSEQREYATLDRIGLQQIRLELPDGSSKPLAWVEGKEIPVEEIAQHDGLSLADFAEWFFHSVHQPQDRIFEGVIIHFTDFRY